MTAIKANQLQDPSMLSLLMIAMHFPPEATAGVHRSLRFAKYLPDFGCQPYVMTRNRPPEPGGDDLLKQVPEGVVVHRIGKLIRLPRSKQESQVDGNVVGKRTRYQGVRNVAKSILLPPWELVSETPDQHVGWAQVASQRAIEQCKESHFDAIYTTGPPHSTHLIGCKVKHKFGLPWVADFRDPWARHNWEKQRNPWGRRLKPYFERKVVRTADRVVLNNEASRDEFRANYPDLPTEKFVAIPNGFDPELIQQVTELQLPLPHNIKSDASTKRSPVICHPGTLYRQREPRPILKAIANLRKQGQDIRFQQMGLATGECDPARIGAELGIEDLVEVVPRGSHTEALERMSQADILLVIQPNAPLQIPGKLYEMLLFDKPIIGICESRATSAVLESAGNAWSVSSTDIAAIEVALQDSLACDWENVREARLRARDCFDGRALSRRLRDVVVSAIKNQVGTEH